MRKVIIFALLLAFVGLMAECAEAEGPITKLGRGLANTLTGWYEIPKEMMSVTETDGDMKGLFVAPFVGLWKGLVRTGAGLYEILTFPIPLPADYEPVVYPEYVFK